MVLKTNEDAAKWVAYLHGLGPTSSNTNAFDEWLTRTVRKTGICPVEIGGDFDDEIVKKSAGNRFKRPVRRPPSNRNGWRR